MRLLRESVSVGGAFACALSWMRLRQTSRFKSLALEVLGYALNQRDTVLLASLPAVCVGLL